MEKYTSSFVNKIFENREADIVYKYKNKNIFFLIEHQTKIDYSMPYRILEYEIEIMKSAIDIRKIKNKEYKLPLVIPIVLYTGKKKWDAKRYLEESQETLKGVKIKAGNYNLVDINDFTKEELLTGMNIELEHGTINPETNVTNDNLILTTKIALAHLNEFPNYYNSRYGLTMFEKFLKEKMNEK